MVSNATFNNISVIVWRSVLSKQPTCQKSQTLSHNVVSSTPHRTGFELATLVVA